MAGAYQVAGAVTDIMIWIVQLQIDPNAVSQASYQNVSSTLI